MEQVSSRWSTVEPKPSNTSQHTPGSLAAAAAAEWGMGWGANKKQERRRIWKRGDNLLFRGPIEHALRTGSIRRHHWFLDSALHSGISAHQGCLLTHQQRVSAWPAGNLQRSTTAVDVVPTMHQDCSCLFHSNVAVL